MITVYGVMLGIPNLPIGQVESGESEHQDTWRLKHEPWCNTLVMRFSTTPKQCNCHGHIPERREYPRLPWQGV